jgi:hypothetical protein
MVTLDETISSFIARSIVSELRWYSSSETRAFANLNLEMWSDGIAGAPLDTGGSATGLSATDAWAEPQPVIDKPYALSRRLSRAVIGAFARSKNRLYVPPEPLGQRADDV